MRRLARAADVADQEDVAEAEVDSVEDVVVAEDADSKFENGRGCWKIPGDFSDVERICPITAGAFARLVLGSGPLLSAWHEIIRR